jgi:hypothetical protein
VGKGPWSLIGWAWSWRSSLPSFAPAALVGASPLLAKQPLVGFCLHRPAPAFHGGIASRLLAQPALWAEPVFLSSSRGDSWDAYRQIARHVACPISHPHDTGPRNWRSPVGLPGAPAGSPSSRSLVYFRRGPRILRMAWRPWPRSRTHQSIADRLGTSRLRGGLGGRMPRGRPPHPGSLGPVSSGIGLKHHLCARRHTMSNSSGLWILCGNCDGCLTLTRSWLTTKGPVANSSWAKHAIDSPLLF